MGLKACNSTEKSIMLSSINLFLIKSRNFSFTNDFYNVIVLFIILKF